jgi:hypothetical protein
MAEERVGSVQGALIARYHTVAKNAKWVIALIAFFGLPLWATIEAQQKCDEKWRNK